jgi:hypothetical protein
MIATGIRYTYTIIHNLDYIHLMVIVCYKFSFIYTLNNFWEELMIYIN